MSDLITIAANVRAAAKTRDAAALRTAAAEHAALTMGELRSSARLTTSTLAPRDMGAALICGAGASMASALEQRLVNHEADGSDTRIASLPADQWPKRLQSALAHVSLLRSQWRALPKPPDPRWPMGVLARRKHTAYKTMLANLASGQPAKITNAIAAAGRLDDAKFSILAYALFAEARRRGFAVKVPRKYDF